MNWTKKQENYEVTNANMDKIGVDYIKISEAPSLEALSCRALKTKRTLEQVMGDESLVRYKASNTKTGDLVLVQNPALLAYQTHLFERSGVTKGTVTRKPPKVLMTFAQVKAVIDEEEKRKRRKEKEEIWQGGTDTSEVFI